MKVWSLRHPPVDRKGRCIGQTRMETTESTLESVEAVVADAPFVPERIFSSDLPRCARLAEGLAAHWNIELEISASLREMSFGEWEGRSYDEIDSMDGSRWRAWCADWIHGTPPAGESAEDLARRVSMWLASRRPSSTDLLVTHAGVIRVLRVLSGESWDDAMVAQCPFLGWSEHPDIRPLTD